MVSHWWFIDHILRQVVQLLLRCPIRHLLRQAVWPSKNGVSSGRLVQHLLWQVVQPVLRSLIKQLPRQAVWLSKMVSYQGTHWAHTQTSGWTSGWLLQGCLMRHLPRQVIWLLPSGISLGRLTDHIHRQIVWPPESDVSLRRLIEHIPRQVGQLLMKCLIRPWLRQVVQLLPENGVSLERLNKHVSGHIVRLLHCMVSHWKTHQALSKQDVWLLPRVVSHWGDSLSTYLEKLANFSWGVLSSHYLDKLSDFSWEWCLIVKTLLAHTQTSCPTSTKNGVLSKTLIKHVPRKVGQLCPKCLIRPLPGQAVQPLRRMSHFGSHQAVTQASYLTSHVYSFSWDWCFIWDTYQAVSQIEQNKKEYKSKSYTYSSWTLGKQLQASPLLCMHPYYFISINIQNIVFKVSSY